MLISQKGRVVNKIYTVFALLNEETEAATKLNALLDKTHLLGYQGITGIIKENKDIVNKLNDFTKLFSTQDVVGTLLVVLITKRKCYFIGSK